MSTHVYTHVTHTHLHTRLHMHAYTHVYIHVYTHVYTLDGPGRSEAAGLKSVHHGAPTCGAS